MPFSSQPRKKGTPGPQDSTKKLSCGHLAFTKDCPECSKSAEAGAKVIDLPTEKKKLTVAKEKIDSQFAKDAKAADKAAFVLANWINGKRNK